MYRTHTLEEYHEVVELRKQGLSLPKIFSFLSDKGFKVSYGAMSDWIYTDKKPFQDKVLNKILPQGKLDVKKAYIFGVLCGDGYVKLTNGFLVGLDVCDEDFADEFRKCLKEVYGLLPSKHKRITKPTNFCDNPKPRYVINLSSKLVVIDLLKYANSFKTKEWKIPEKVLSSSLEVKAGFLRGLFDSEGSATLRKPGGVYLSVCSGNKSSLLKVKEMLKNSFHIDLSINCNQNSFMRLKSAGYKNVKRFYSYIGFTIKRKQVNLENGLLTYTRKGVRRYSIEFKKNALKMLDKYGDPCFVAGLLGISNSNVYDWKNGRYMGF